MNKTGIQYLDYTWNPTVGCSPISSGCRSCWAKIMSKRLKAMGNKDYQLDDPFKPRFLSHRLDEPIEKEKPSRIGVSFMGDLFHDEMKEGLEPWEKVYTIFYTMMNMGRQHAYFVLTKRPKNMLEFFTEWIRPYDNVNNIYCGVSIEDQKSADERVSVLLQIPAAARWASYEPALGRVDFSKYLDHFRKLDSIYKANIQNGMINEDQADSLKEPILDWVVMGAETGTGARPFNILWGRHTRNQCWAAGVPFFFKSAGKQKIPDDLMVREYPK